MIQTYFGNGKGKTTAALGSAIRCAGSGGEVMFVQLLKNNASAEFNLLEKIENIKVKFSCEKYNLYDNLNPECTQRLVDAYDKFLFEDVKKEAHRCNMIILDEILDAIDFGYIKEEKLLDMIKKLKCNCEIILTGHKITDNIMKVSDYISEIKEINHPYTKGVLSREGIEY